MFGRKESKTYHQHQRSIDGEEFTQSSQLTPNVIENLTKELKRIGIKDYFELNTMVTEVLGNAIEHGIRGKNINWWMHLYVERGNLKMVFVDMGIGIASSYRRAHIGLLRSDGWLVRKALQGEIGSSTKKPNRGRGLPQMDFMVRKNFISNFILITNNVTLRYINGKYETESHPNFVGTYYSMDYNQRKFY